MTAPEPVGVETFRLVGYDFDATSNVARLDYAFDDAHLFREVIEFGGAPLDKNALSGMERTLRLVHLAAGVSYYKAAAPGRISVETGPLTGAESDLVRDLYDKGLREFAQANHLPVPLEFSLELDPGRAVGGQLSGAAAASRGGGPGPAPPPGVGVPVGGGKDSIVLTEAVKAASLPTSLPVWLVAINPHPAMERTARTAGLPLASVTRTLSPKLLELNAAGALNGHVPITAILSLVVAAAGYVYGYDTTLMALERSADEATSMVGEVAVNHQWSKSTECELAVRSVLRESVSPSIEYASPLRSCGELEIARWFAELPDYHRGFRSCNRVFRAGGSFDGWCGNCPKCRFVFLVLAAFLGPDSLVAIFGHNLLEDLGQLEGFRDLYAQGRKPYECVGEQRESLLAFLLLLESPLWRDSAVVAALRDELESSRNLVGADLDAGVPVLEGRDATRERVVRLIRHVAERDAARV